MSRVVNSASCIGYYNNNDYGYCRDFVEDNINRWDPSSRLSCEYDFNTYWTGSTTAFQLTAICEGRTANPPRVESEALIETAPEFKKNQGK